MAVIILILGFALLIKGAHWFVEAASHLARLLKVSDIVIGLTVVAFGTSTPEVFVNIMASLAGSDDIVIGNILGSNTANVLLILGISGIIYPLKVMSNTVWKEIPLSILAAFIFYVLVNDHLIDGHSFQQLSRIDGIVLLSFFGIFLTYVVNLSKQQGDIQDQHILSLRWGKTLFLLAGGLACLVVGGKLVVEGAVDLARFLGVSESLIGLTVVAVGTSLPELATSVVAAMKKNADIAVGNIVGSNIFNIFFILGISAIIRPVAYNSQNNIDALVGLGAAALTLFVMFVGKKKTFARSEGILFVALYVAYIVFLIQRG
jgi:cation:H+ antiporter